MKPEPLDLVVLKKSGEVMNLNNCVGLKYDKYKGTRRAKLLDSGQIRMVRDCLILSVNGMEVFLWYLQNRSRTGLFRAITLLRYTCTLATCIHEHNYPSVFQVLPKQALCPAFFVCISPSAVFVCSSLIRLPSVDLRLSFGCPKVALWLSLWFVIGFRFLFIPLSECFHFSACSWYSCHFIGYIFLHWLQMSNLHTLCSCTFSGSTNTAVLR